MSLHETKPRTSRQDELIEDILRILKCQEPLTVEQHRQLEAAIDNYTREAQAESKL